MAEHEQYFLVRIKEYDKHVGDSMILHSWDEVRKAFEDSVFGSAKGYVRHIEVYDYEEEYGYVRTCETCGKDVFEGWSDDEGTFHCHDGECYTRYMDEEYGIGNWGNGNEDDPDYDFYITSWKE